MKINVSQAAKEEIKKQTEGNDRKPRIYVAGIGCSRAKFAMNIDNPRDGDEEMEADGIKFLVESDLSKVIERLDVDYESEGVHMGFSITEGLEDKTC